MNRKYTLVTLFTAAMLFLLSACSGTPQVTTTSTLTVGNEVGDLAPDFSLKDLSGNSVSLSGLKGRPVVLNFWSAG